MMSSSVTTNARVSSFFEARRVERGARRRLLTSQLHCQAEGCLRAAHNRLDRRCHVIEDVARSTANYLDALHRLAREPGCNDHWLPAMSLQEAAGDVAVDLVIVEPKR